VTINKQSPWFLFLMAGVGICVYAIVIFVQPRETTERMILGRNDFMQFYAGGRLSGSPAIYSRDAVQQVMEDVVGVRSDSISHFSRLPFYSLFMRPLAMLPYRAAYYLFQSISILCFLLFLWMFIPGCRELAAYASLSIPFVANLQNGQDATLVLLAAGLSIFLFRKDKLFWAGFALSFCAIKFHLFTLVPVIILIQRRWLMLWGVLASGAILLALSFAGAGAHWPKAYIEAVGAGRMHPHPDYMPNLHTLSVLLNGAADFAVELILSIAVIGTVVYLASKAPEYELAFAFALVGGLLISFHSYPQDCVVLLLSLAILLGKPFSRRSRELTELAVSPIPYFCMLAGAPFNLVMPTILLAILGTAAYQAWRSSLVPQADHRR